MLGRGLVRAKRFHGLALLGPMILSAAVAAPARAASASAGPALRRIEVLVQVPPSNFAYRQGNQRVFGPATPSASAGVPLVLSPGVSFGAALGINLVANVVASGIEAAAAATAREAVGPVGASLEDVDLRATVFEQLRSLRPEGAPDWVHGSGAFPEPEQPPQVGGTDPATGLPYTPPAVDPVKPLVERAKSSAHDATLFIRVLPLFRGLGGRMYVNTAAMLIDKSGVRLAEWITQLTAPTGPDLERPELIRWWAEGRYRRFVAEGLRAGLAPIAQDIADRALRAQRLKQLEAVLAQRFDESGRPADPVKGFELNALRMRSTVCTLQAEPGPLTYRYERTRAPNQLLAAAYCSAEQITDWSQDVAPGLSWTHDADKPPKLVTRTAQ